MFLWGRGGRLIDFQEVTGDENVFIIRKMWMKQGHHMSLRVWRWVFFATCSLQDAKHDFCVPVATGKHERREEGRERVQLIGQISLNGAIHHFNGVSVCVCVCVYVCVCVCVG